MSSLVRASLVAAAVSLLGGCDASSPPTSPEPQPDRTDASATASLTCDACVLGPLVLTRTVGAPVAHTWNVPAQSGATYVLRLDDLGSHGANAELTLNGAPLPWRFDSTGARRHQARIPLVLLAANTLTARLTGMPGSQLGIALEPSAPPTATLSVAIGAANAPTTSGARNGPANGRVTAPGIDCVLTNDVASGDCSEAYPLGTVVTLVPTPGERSMLWESYLVRSDGVPAGACTAAPDQACSLTVTQDTAYVAHFAPQPTVLVVTLSGPPGTSAWINGNEISCYLRDGVMDGPCGYRYFGGVLEFTLRVFPMDAVFTGWSGACTGTSTECPLTSQPGDTVRVTATFAPLAN